MHDHTANHCIRWTVFLLEFLLICWLFLPSVYAQIGTNFVLQGNVLDASGGAVLEATVTIRNVSIGSVRSVVSDANGHYIFAALPPSGSYELTVAKNGFATQTMTGLTFLANAAPVINVTLKPGGLQQTVTVSGEAPIVETDKSEIDNTITQQDISNLPTNGRSFFDFTKLAPGAVSVTGGFV